MKKHSPAVKELVEFSEKLIHDRILWNPRYQQLQEILKKVQNEKDA